MKNTEPVRFDSNDLPNKSQWHQFFIATLFWVIPAALASLVVQWIGYLTSNSPLPAAAEQAVGPELWSVIGLLGLLSFGVMLPFATSARIGSLFAWIASRLLYLSVEIGLLSLGVMLGEIIWVTNAASSVALWQAWFYGLGSAVLFATLLVLNTGIWTLSAVLDNSSGKTSFVKKVETQTFERRLSTFIIVLVLVISILFYGA